MSKNLLILLVSLLSFIISTPCWGQDSTYRLSPKQQDSLIRLSEGLKTLRELFNVSIKEVDTYKALWQWEKDNRAKDKTDYQVIIDGYVAIDQSNKNEITALKKQVRKATRGKRLWQVLTGIAVGFAVYSTLK